MSFTIPLTQLHFGDLTGLSTVHVNRSIRTLQEEGLLIWKNQRVTVLDRPKLRELSCRPERTPCHDPAWFAQLSGPPAD